MNVMLVMPNFLSRDVANFSINRWVVIPVWLMYDSYSHIASSIRAAQASARVKKN